LSCSQRMLTFLFWNMGGELPESADADRIAARHRRLLGILRNLTGAHAVDLLMLAECPLSQTDVLQSINPGRSPPYREPDPRSLCQRIQVYPRSAARFLLRRDESPFYTGRLVKLPARDSFLLYVVHLVSKTQTGDESQSQEMPVFSAMIRNRESTENLSRTIVVGDFNMNPFETGMVSAQGLNAVMARDVARAESRDLHGVTYPFFYNPMWSQFGDSMHEIHPLGSPDHEPPGTCYYSAGESKWFYWSMLDQVMLRPSLLNRFRNSDLKILVTDRETDFLNQNGRPDRSRVSDHLSVLFRLNL
jgi:Endonuclease/Exonuclease/phosphatase family